MNVRLYTLRNLFPSSKYFNKQKCQSASIKSWKGSKFIIAKDKLIEEAKVININILFSIVSSEATTFPLI